MTNAKFASLHAGMLERGPAHSNFGSGHDGGKVVQTIMRPQIGWPIAKAPRPDTKAPAIRLLLDQVANWTSLPVEGKTLGPRASSGSSASRAQTSPCMPKLRCAKQVPRPQQLLPASHALKLFAVVVPVAAAAEQAVATLPASRPAKPKRKAMTLRLEPDNHRRLRQASSELGRSCQDILFAAMNRYLDGLDLVEASDEGFFKLEKG